MRKGGVERSSHTCQRSQRGDGWLTAASPRLACAAFNDVFQRRQTRYRAFLDWLRAQQRAGGMHHGIDMSELTKCLDGRGSGTARGGRKSRQRNNTGAPEQKAEVDQGGDGDSAVGKAGQRWAVGTEKV